MLFNPAGSVFVGRRSDMPAGLAAWQMPQGGIDKGETPRQAALRELKEEIGTDKAEILTESRRWLYYDVPAEIGWGAVDKPDPQNPVGVKGVGEPVQGSGAAAITSAIADALGGHLFNRTPVSLDMILNHLNKRPQAHKPLQINTV